MSQLDKNIKRNPITQNDRYRLLQSDYDNLKDNGYTARMAIWSYVEIDEPIPNELKPILREILLADFTGKKQKDTSCKWTTVVKKVAFHIVQHNTTRDVAVEAVANDNHLNHDTLMKEYSKGKYRELKDNIMGVQK